MENCEPFQKIVILPHFTSPDQRLHIGLIKHPKIGWQLCAGSVEKGEEPVDAAVRELREETGEVVLLQRMQLLFKERSDSQVLADDFGTGVFSLKRGWPITIEGQSNKQDHLRARYTEYLDGGVDYEITFSIPKAMVAPQIERYFFTVELSPAVGKQRMVNTDGHDFLFRYFEVNSLPALAEPHACWLTKTLDFLAP